MAESSANTGKDWNYYPLSERFKENTAVAITALGYGFALLNIFNPVAASAAMAYGVGKMSYSYYKMTREGADKELVKGGYLSEPRQERTQRWVNEAVDVMDMLPHKAYRLEEKLIKAITPRYIRWAFDKLPSDTRQDIMKNAAYALTTHDLTAISGEFLEKHPERQEYFAVMHEMSHCKVEDSSNTMSAFKVVKKHALKALGLATAATIAAGLVGLGPGSSLILASGVGLFKAAAMVLGAGFAANLGINYASRIMERCADRNAVFLTRDAQAAEDLVRAMHNNKTSSLDPYLECTRTHPGMTERIANIRAAANQAAAYAPLQTAVDPAIAATSSKEPEAEAPRRGDVQWTFS